MPLCWSCVILYGSLCVSKTLILYHIKVDKCGLLTVFLYGKSKPMIDLGLWSLFFNIFKTKLTLASGFPGLIVMIRLQLVDCFLLVNFIPQLQTRGPMSYKHSPVNWPGITTKMKKKLP